MGLEKEFCNVRDRGSTSWESAAEQAQLLEGQIGIYLDDARGVDNRVLAEGRCVEEMEYRLAPVLAPEPNFPIARHLLPHRIDPKVLAHVRVRTAAWNTVAALSMKDRNHMITLFQIGYTFTDALNDPEITESNFAVPGLEHQCMAFKHIDR